MPRHVQRLRHPLGKVPVRPLALLRMAGYAPDFCVAGSGQAATGLGRELLVVERLVVELGVAVL